MVIFLGPHHEGVVAAEALDATPATAPVKSIDAAAAAEITAAILRRRIIFVSSI
jgi:hypothetical protein